MISLAAKAIRPGAVRAFTITIEPSAYFRRDVTRPSGAPLAPCSLPHAYGGRSHRPQHRVVRRALTNAHSKLCNIAPQSAPDAPPASSTQAFAADAKTSPAPYLARAAAALAALRPRTNHRPSSVPGDGAKLSKARLPPARSPLGNALSAQSRNICSAFPDIRASCSSSVNCSIIDA